DIKNWQTLDSMPFDVQNDFIKTAAGIDEKMFTNVPLSSFDYTYMNITNQINDNEYKYELTDPANLSLHPTVTSKIISDKDQYLYLYVDAGNTKNVTYITDTANEQRELSAGKSLFDIGHVKAGEEITVKFELTNKGEFEHTYRKDGTVKIYAASYDDAVFQKAYDKLKTQPFEITSFKDTEITGNITADKDGVMLTSIPYVPGWKVTVDGESVKKVSVGEDGLIGVDLTKGSHTVTFKYSPSGFAGGIFISIVSVVCAVAYTVLLGKKKKITVNAA
ncbi:MAG: YfhO family protein, partial [Firmicutes bacterium]|nr:YfhO family protein [Bacillota bacterium]